MRGFEGMRGLRRWRDAGRGQTVCNSLAVGHAFETLAGGRSELERHEFHHHASGAADVIGLRHLGLDQRLPDFQAPRGRADAGKHVEAGAGSIRVLRWIKDEQGEQRLMHFGLVRNEGMLAHNQMRGVPQVAILGGEGPVLH